MASDKPMPTDGKMFSFNIDEQDPLRRIQVWMEVYGTKYRDDLPLFDRVIMRKGGMECISTTSEPVPGAVYELKVVNELCSRTGNMHGAAASLVFDMCTSMAVATVSRKGFWEFSGVSRNLNVSYYRPIPVNCVVTVECWVEQIGKQMATVKAIMKRKADGAILCACQHDKATVDVTARMVKM